jgi:fatty acid desaturase
MTTTDAFAAFRATEPRDPNWPSYTTAYAALLETVSDAGLLKRRIPFYALLFSGLVLALGGLCAGFFLLGSSWLQLLVAAALGIVLTQFAFMAHEAAHRQVLVTGKANDGVGRALGTYVVGISYEWWMSKHTRHHGNPNRIDKDPDIDTDTISFFEEAAAGKKGFGRWLTMHQGTLFFPLLMLEGVNLHYRSVSSLVEKRPVRGRAVELTGIALRFAIYFTVLFWFLPVGLAFAFIGVQLAVFGLYMGASFAPNHKGMPIVSKDARLDFFSRQVVTSRNISGGWRSSALLGGLNYQVEHHLFPNMPRPNLGRARQLVREECAALGVPYTETTLMKSYGIVVRYLNKVGIAARDPFLCPVYAAYRIH